MKSDKWRRKLKERIIMIKIINCTPHAINITDGPTFKPSGTVTRVDTIQSDAGSINDIPVKTQTFGDIIDLPEPQDDTVFIVSAIVLAAAKEKGRTDVVAPDTSNAVRNDQGHIVSVPGFIK